MAELLRYRCIVCLHPYALSAGSQTPLSSEFAFRLMCDEHVKRTAGGATVWPHDGEAGVWNRRDEGYGEMLLSIPEQVVGQRLLRVYSTARRTSLFLVFEDRTLLGFYPDGRELAVLLREGSTMRAYDFLGLNLHHGAKDAAVADARWTDDFAPLCEIARRHGRLEAIGDAADDPLLSQPCLDFGRYGLWRFAVLEGNLPAPKEEGAEDAGAEPPAEEQYDPSAPLLPAVAGSALHVGVFEVPPPEEERKPRRHARGGQPERGARPRHGGSARTDRPAVGGGARRG